jgi:transmembrane sensor
MLNPSGTKLREVLKDPIERDQVDRLWSGIAAKRARQRGRPVATQVAGALALAAASVVWFNAQRVTPREDGALHLDNGSPLLALAAPDAPLTLVFGDRSRVELGRGARVEPETNTASALVLRLQDGEATFDVTPGGARRWSVECDRVTVDVIGTRFHVMDKGNGRVHIAVDHGIVVVRGDGVLGETRRLVDGQSIDVGESLTKGDPLRAPATAGASLATAAVPSPPVLTTPSSAAPSSGPPLHAAATFVASTAAPPQTAAWQALARSGKYDDAYQLLGQVGLAHESAHASVDELLALADVARLSGHSNDAVVPLSRVLDEHGADPQASLAAFTLGRVELDSLGRPARAASAFSRAIAIGLPQGLIEDAYARLVEARVRAGDREAARAAADEYARKYPRGTRGPTIRRWLGDD